MKCIWVDLRQEPRREKVESFPPSAPGYGTCSDALCCQVPPFLKGRDRATVLSLALSLSLEQPGGWTGASRSQEEVEFVVSQRHRITFYPQACLQEAMALSTPKRPSGDAPQSLTQTASPENHL